MAIPIKPNIGTKTDYAARPSVPSNQKESSTEFNLVVNAIRANYERLILDWDTDIDINVTLPVGQFVLYDSGIYRITNSYNVSSPITWDDTKAELLIQSPPNHFKGKYTSEANLIAAHPTGVYGDYAIVDAGIGSTAINYIFDEDDATWRAGSASSAVWGAITGTLSLQADLMSALNLKSDSTFNITAKTGSYTMAAAEVNIINAGGSLIMESTSGDLTLPNALLGAGKSFAVRGFANMVNGGTMVITGTNGTLVIPAGRTCVVEVLSATTAILHNGTATGTAWTTTSAGGVEQSIQSEAELIASGAQANSTAGLSNDRAPSEIGLFYTIRKIMTLAWTWTVQQTLSIGPIISDSTASTPAWFNGSKKLVTAAVTDLLDWLGLNPISAAVSLVSTTVTLDCNSKYKRKWHTVAAHSANFTLTKTNKTNFEEGEYNFLVTGTVVVQLDSDDRMPDDTPGWNYASKQLTLVSGGTGLMYCIAFNKAAMSSVYQVATSTKTTV